MMNTLVKRYAPWLFFTPGMLLSVITILAAAFMFYSSWHESPIMDELAHIPAGYDYVHYFDYRLNPEHPPLVKALSALPLLPLDLNFPTQTPDWTTAVNAQWGLGANFLYHSGNNPDVITRAARLFPILLTLLLILLVYRVGKDRLGRFWALLPAFLVAFSPIVLAHGHYVTTDIGATFGVLLSLWRAVVYFERPSRKNLWLAGLSLGVAELLKFSTVLVVAYILFLALSHWFRRRREKSILPYAGAYLAMLAIAYFLVVYPVYALFTARYPMDRQTSDTIYTLGSFGGGAAASGCHGTRCLADLDIALTKHALTRPFAQYMLGVLMVMQRADGGNTAYFLGHVSAAGSRWYFPVVYLLKETLPALILVLVPLLAWLIRSFRNLRRTPERLGRFVEDDFLGFALAGFAVFYWLYSVKSPLNIGVRHILPTFPLVYILAAGAWRRWIARFAVTRNSVGGFLSSLLRSTGRLLFGSVFLALLLLWAFLETAFAAPHFLSYFNEIGGGTSQGYRYVLDSNYDWGQDLLALRDFLNTHSEIDKIGVNYFGGGDPAYYLGGRAVIWNSANGDPRAQGIHWFAISVNNLQGSIQPAATGFIRKPEDEYRWLTAFRAPESGLGGVPEPDYRVGTSIFVYHLP